MRFATALLTTMLPLLANGQAQLLPVGEFSARDGRPGPGKTWRVSDEQGLKLAEAMNAVIASTPIVIDYEHQTLNTLKNGQPAPAAGWIRSVTWLTGKGLVSDVEWTERARAAITAGEYRFISPVITWNEVTGVVTGVHLAALTNFPALLGMDAAVAALSALNEPQEPSMKLLLASLATLLALPALAAAQDEAAAVSILQGWKPPKASLPEALTSALGLSASADESAALSAVTALKAPKASDPTTVQTIAALQQQVATLTAQVTGDKVTSTVDEAIKAGKLVPAQRDWAIGYGKNDLAALTTFIATAPVVPLAGQTGGAAKPGGTPGQVTDALTGNVMAQFGLNAEQFAKGAPATA